MSVDKRLQTLLDDMQKDLRNALSSAQKAQERVARPYTESESFKYWDEQPIRHYTPPPIYRQPISEDRSFIPQYNLAEEFFHNIDNGIKSPISETNKKQDSIMSLMNLPGLNISFGKLPAGKIALGLDGKPVFRGPSGWVAISQDEKGNRTQVNTLDLKLDIDFFKIPTQELAAGDLVEIDGQILLVEENSKGGIKFINPVTGGRSSKLPQTNVFGMHFYSKIVSMFDLGNGQQGGLGLGAGINPMTLMLLQGKGGAGSDITEMLIMSQLLGGQGGQINPMMLMMLGDNASGDSLSKFLLMSQMMGGNNPFAAVASPLKAHKSTTKRVATPAPTKAAAKTATKKATKTASKTGANKSTKTPAPVRAIG